MLVGFLWWAGSCAPSARLSEPRMELESPLLRGTESPAEPVPVTPPTTVSPAVNIPIAIPAQPYASEPIVELGTIEIPAIGLVHRIYQGVTLNNIDRGPSHWTGTALPGQPGNAVFAGHRVTRSRPFRNIDALVPGNEVIFTVRGVRSIYRVTGNQVVTPKDLWIGDQTPGYHATLYACHPPGSAQYRFVVHLEMI